MATETTQLHPLATGETVEITRRDGRGHKYLVDGVNDGKPMPSVTGMIGHVESGVFSIASGWATKQIRLAGGDLDAPKRVGDKAVADGNDIHDAIERYIKTGEVTEENPGFISWLKTVGNDYEWIAGEAYLYHPILQYGGTLDAISTTSYFQRYAFNPPETLWDWKTKDPETYWKYGGSLKDHAQVASYVMALREMGSAYAPAFANIAYIMRDGSGTDVIPVNLEVGRKLFSISRDLYLTTALFKDNTKPGTQQEGN
jgi:hypothetical protein